MSSIILEFWCNLSTLFYHQMLKKVILARRKLVLPEVESFNTFIKFHTVRAVRAKWAVQEVLQVLLAHLQDNFKHLYRGAPNHGHILGLMWLANIQIYILGDLGDICNGSIQSGCCVIPVLGVLLLPENQIPFCQHCLTWPRMVSFCWLSVKFDLWQDINRYFATVLLKKVKYTCKMGSF